MKKFHNNIPHNIPIYINIWYDIYGNITWNIVNPRNIVMNMNNIMSLIGKVFILIFSTRVPDVA